MPKLIKDGAVVEDSWQGELTGLEHLGQEQGDHLGVRLEPGDGVEALLPLLDRIGLVAIHFPVFTDGRGFSYARELREAGYTGEIRATGKFIRDQLFYLQRCGFNAFEFDADVDLDACLDSLSDFSDAYQASIDQPQPLFRRRA